MNEKFFGEEFRIKLTDLINTGKPPLEIVLELAKAIGQVSGEDSYYQTTREQIFAVYGLALHDKFILEHELFNVKARLDKLYLAYENPEFTDEEHTRIGYAIQRHKKELDRLQRLLT